MSLTAAHLAAPASCSFTLSLHLAIFPALSQQPCLPPGWGARVCEPGASPPLFIVMRWESRGVLPALGEGLLWWAGEKALQRRVGFGVGAAELD